MAENNNTLELAKKVKKAQDENKFNGIKSLQELSDDFLNDLEQQEEEKLEDNNFNYSKENLSPDEKFKQDVIEGKTSDISSSPSQIAPILPENNLQVAQTQPMPQVGPTIENEQKMIEEQAQDQNQPIEVNSERNISSIQPENQISDYEKGLNAALDIRQQKNAEIMNKTLNEKADVENKINEAKKNIEGANIFKSGTVGQKILAGLAVFFGGLGSGPNYALQILQDQENKIIDQNKDLLNKYTSQLGDIKKAEIAIKTDFYDTLEEKVTKMAEIAHPSQKLKYQEMIAGIQEKRSKIDSQLLEMTQKNILAKGGKLTEEMARTLPKEDKERIVRDKYGKLMGLADSKEKAQKLSEQIETIAPSIDGIEKLERFAKQGNIFDPRKRAEVDTIIGTIVGALRLPITGPGILTDSEREMLKGLIGNPNKLMSLQESNLRRLSTIKNFLNSTVDVKMKTAGIKSVKSPDELGFKEK